MKHLRFTNNDIPFEVLSRLSARDLHRLKFVSKEWQNLVSERSFIRTQLKNMQALSGFFFQEKYQWCDEDISRISYIPLETSTELHCTVFKFLSENVVILASCNGLICCRSGFPSRKPLLYVCNPLNKEWTSFEWNHPSKNSSVALVFYPSRFPIGDVSTNFKVVTVSKIAYEDEYEYEEEEVDKDEDEGQFMFDIYSSKTRNWERSREICQCKHNLFKNKGIFVDGLLYWLTDGDQILMFDSELELSWFITVPLPPTEFQSIPELCIGVSKGKLHYVLLSVEGLQLWVLEDRFSSLWELALSISVSDLEKENSQFIGFHLAEMLAKHVRIEMVPLMDFLAFKDGILFVRFSTYMYSFDFETRKMHKLCNLSQLGKNSVNAPIVVPYSMSLAPL